ncbi:MAG TPA: protocatechuate 3,4-dioxygenase subunit alpha [Burkholderiales bacterium]|nr:protocatechuate 3,4-dioxygenase subunit alpha [Burkholderiales bacterium]
MAEADQVVTMLSLTPSQTVGPFFAYCLTPRSYRGDDLVTSDLTVPGVEGPRIVIEGTVFDGRGAPIADAMLELWQADARGRFVQERRPGQFFGFGRAECDGSGHYSVTTIRPGAAQPRHAPHINVHVFAKGLQRQLFTRIYFADESANAEDAVLARVPQAFAHTLLAQPVPDKAHHYRFDIRLQGPEETVFFEA